LVSHCWTIARHARLVDDLLRHVPPQPRGLQPRPRRKRHTYLLSRRALITTKARKATLAGTREGGSVWGKKYPYVLPEFLTQTQFGRKGRAPRSDSAYLSGLWEARTRNWAHLSGSYYSRWTPPPCAAFSEFFRAPEKLQRRRRFSARVPPVAPAIRIPKAHRGSSRRSRISTSSAAASFRSVRGCGSALERVMSLAEKRHQDADSAVTRSPSISRLPHSQAIRGQVHNSL
jgi:hypothetical protein